MKTKVNFLFITVIVCLTTLALSSNAMKTEMYGAGYLTGKICDSTTSLPLENVNVVLHSAKTAKVIAATITNFDGTFSLALLEQGVYYLEITHPGFSKKIVERIDVEASNDKSEIDEVRLVPLDTKKYSRNTYRNNH
jgi:5-hydroxyisourate hydrolase-like protein (transthyretin family)